VAQRVRIGHACVVARLSARQAGGTLRAQGTHQCSPAWRMRSPLGPSRSRSPGRPARQTG
jgi:hypothetical protein